MIFDLFPKLGANKKQRPIIIGLVTNIRFWWQMMTLERSDLVTKKGIICFVLYLLGLTMVTKGGIYIFVVSYLKQWWVILYDSYIHESFSALWQVCVDKCVWSVHALDNLVACFVQGSTNGLAETWTSRVHRRLNKDPCLSYRMDLWKGWIIPRPLRYVRT